MNIINHVLTFETEHHTYALTYRGNENIIVECFNEKNDETSKILLPRFELEKFMEMIKGE
jgi:hypothetical protein